MGMWLARQWESLLISAPFPSLPKVCEACAKECHKGHNVINYMPNHKPSWACCYCPKNRKCTIPNAKTKRPAS